MGQVTYKLERLNEVQYAYDDKRKAALEEKGFKVVSVEGDAKPGDAAKTAKKGKTVKAEGNDVR